MGDGSRHHSANVFVFPGIADPTPATSWPASTSRFTCRATLRIRSILATDVPPNFITRRPMTTGAFPDSLSNVTRAETGSARAKRRVYIAARLGASNRLPANPRALGTLCGGAVTKAERMGRYIDDILQPGDKVLE